ncbi:heterokaryon incompatibility protein-domain-containing protein [Diaporthe sp. PMI_573]|nr:heterokaryon incompatibility protein-domain-containing protein [Diaporthaceae sp. PMI_573]
MVTIYAYPLRLHDGGGHFLVPLLLRVFVELGEQQPGAEIPIFPESGSVANYLLCRAWLGVCDQGHNHVQSYIARLPTRVIDVGERPHPHTVHLRITNREAHGIYIALSHRWQDGTPQTTEANLDERRNGIELASLPRVYREAVRITRALGIRYLWIDSLCIIQGGSQDWGAEAGRMEEVFASAYCTIAISPPTAAGRAGGGGSFEEDVEKGELSRRGWIFQERALSRRTIHFIGDHIYWECEACIWSEVADYRVKPSTVLSSSRFPNFQPQGDEANEFTAFRDVFSRYSQLELTFDVDRPVALLGLESRLENLYKTNCVYGIVRKFFGESLLWQRSAEWIKPLSCFGGNDPLSSIKASKVPSWSWMAYTGAIRYGSLDTNGLQWQPDIALQYEQDKGSCVLSAPRVQISPSCTIIRTGTDSEVQDEHGKLVGWVRHDCEEYADNTECRDCICVGQGSGRWDKFVGVLGKSEPSASFSYVLILKALWEEEFHRIGMGVINFGCLSPPGDKVKVY